MYLHHLILIVLVTYYSNIHTASVSTNGKPRSIRPPANGNATYDSSETEFLNLPNGFKPQPAPVNPLLYPFVTETPPVIHLNISTPDWTPIVNMITSTQRNAYIPILQDRISNTSESQSLEEGPIFESVVYGAWKPEPPLLPDKIFNFSNNVLPSRENNEHRYLNHMPLNYDNSDHTSITAVNEQQQRQPQPTASPSENYQQEQSTDWQQNQHITITKSEHQKIPKIIEDAESSEKVLIIKVNMTNPTLLAMAKQINQSAEKSYFSPRPKISIQSTPSPTTHLVNSKEKEQDHLGMEAQQIEIINTAESATTEPTKLWPTDFMKSNNSILTPTNYNYVGDTAEPPENLDNLNLPNVSLNITKMGEPYEIQNSTEDPQICVPLTLREVSANSNPTEYLDVERIYCFPLPPPEVELTSESITELQERVTVSSLPTTISYNLATIANLNKYLFIIACSLLLRLHKMFL